MNKLPRVFCAFFLVVVMDGLSAGWMKAASVCSLTPTAFSIGETISYQVYYNWGFIWIHAGECELRTTRELLNGTAWLNLTATGKTIASWDPVFQVRDTLISLVDEDQLIPYVSYKYTHEKSWHGVDVIQFQPTENGFRIKTTLKRKGAWKAPVYDETRTCGFDMLTSVYRLRCLDNQALFIKGKRTTIPIRLDDGEYNIYLTYRGKETLKLFKGDAYPAHAFEMTLIEGKVFKRGDVLKLWVSDDGNKLPLMVETPIKVGTVKAVFKQVSQNRYPLNKGGN